ncbi:MAG: sigma 54-interacting transcriptional regulator, partial [Polyangiaceae bacterium]
MVYDVGSERKMRATEDYELPELPASEGGIPALVVAFPRSSALPLPTLNQPLGRAWFESVGIEDSKVSRDHVRFSRAGSVLQLEDVGSRNGTWVNGHRLSPNVRVRIDDGAVLRIGRTLLVYRQHLTGGPHPLNPSPRLGGPTGLVGPYGLRRVEERLGHFGRRPPRNVLILGETGSGKELLARALADHLRAGRPYVALNVASVAAGVFEGQLFGYVGGAFSGAGRGSPGVVMQHNGGTVFLDEVGELGLELQPKLLRLLDNREVFAVGATQPQLVDVLIIAATNRVLPEMVDGGGFRRDLYARFAGCEVHLPGLRERPEDLYAIANAIMARSGDVAYDPDQVDVEAVEALMLQPWPANVRELFGVLETAASYDLPPALKVHGVHSGLNLSTGFGGRGAPSSGNPGVLSSNPVAAPAPLTPEIVERVLEQCGGNRSEAARRLGVSRGQLLR